MHNQPPRAAVFLDFENLVSSLKNQSRRGIGDFGTTPDLDFAAFVEHVQSNYGSLDKEDFFAAANFTHYNSQLGGLNRWATILEVDSFEPRAVRQQEQNSPGKRHVIEQYADMVLAFEAGRHIAINPADVYIFISGDKAFAAVADSIRARFHKQVIFFLPDPDHSASLTLKEQFLCLPFEITQPVTAVEEIPVQVTEIHEGLENPSNQIKPLVSHLREALSTAIPSDMVRAVLGPGKAQKLLDRARSEEQIDLWQNPQGVECVSSRSERLFGKLQIMDSRPAVIEASRILLSVATAAESRYPPSTRAEWRKHIKDCASLSNSAAKQWLELLLEKGVLRDHALTRPMVNQSTLTAVILAFEKLSNRNGTL
jgi:hypothetical protein